MTNGGKVRPSIAALGSPGRSLRQSVDPLHPLHAAAALQRVAGEVEESDACQKSFVNFALTHFSFYSTLTSFPFAAVTLEPKGQRAEGKGLQAVAGQGHGGQGGETGEGVGGQGREKNFAGSQPGEEGKKAV